MPILIYKTQLNGLLVQSMLLGKSPLISPDLPAVLYCMGHGDEREHFVHE
jgi:hypothetical protein